MVIFNSYVKLPEGKCGFILFILPWERQRKGPVHRVVKVPELMDVIGLL